MVLSGKRSLAAWSRSAVVRGVAVMAATALVVAGCSTSTRILRRDQRVAKVQIESNPPGALALAGDRALGRTPTNAALRYVVEKKEIRPGAYRTGWAVLLAGLATLAVGIAGIVAGSAANSDTGGGTAAQVLGYTFGGLFVAAGVVGVPIGGILLGMTKSRQVVTYTDPSELKLSLRFPGEGGAHRLIVRKKSSGIPAFGKIGRLRYDHSTGGWEAPDLPTSLKLVSKRDPGARLGPAIVAKPKAPGRTIIAVFDIEDKGANLKPALLGRLSDYLAMRLASFKRFKVIPRDQLKARLAKTKSESYKKCYAQSCQIEIGKELAAQKSLATAVVRLGSRCTVTAVVYDLKSAASEGGKTASGGCTEDAIVASLEKMVKTLEKGSGK